MRRVASIALLGALLCACREDKVSTLSSKLALRYLPGCAPARVERVAVEPLGDFALGEQSLTAVSLGAAPALLASLPVDTRWYRLGVTTADYRGVALSRAGAQGESFDALLLPLHQVCAIHSEALPTLTAGAQALVAGDDLLLAGGADASGDGLQEAFILHVTEPSLDADPQGLLVPRAGAAALAVGGETWLLGGATSLRPGSAALDTFERYSHAQNGFISLGRLRARRVEASAVQLLDGRVLIAGGRASVGGAPLASIETLALNGQLGQLWSEPLPFAVAQATLLARDDGSVLLAGRVDGALRLAVIDPRRTASAELEPPVLAAQLAPELTVALPGARVALFELNEQAETTGQLQLLLEDGSYLALADWLSSFAGISQARTLGLGDGRILLTGLRQGQPVARVIDPGTRDVAVRALDVPITQLFKRDDGSVLLVGPDGARIVREDARSPYDNPGGTLLADDNGALSLDAHGRFERSGLSLVAAVAGARFDLAGLRYRDVELSIEVQGDAELLLRPDDGQERSLRVGGAEVGPVFCTLAVEPGAPITVLRRQQRVTLSVGSKRKSCVLDGFQGSVSFALRALKVGVTVRDLRIQRK